MRVYKFGGASVKDADAVRNVGEILTKVKDEPVFVVISAMGKMTNAFEKLIDAYFDGQIENQNEALQSIKDYHKVIIDDLLKNSSRHTFDDIDNLFLELECILETDKDEKSKYDYVYDQLVGFGELISTRIVSAYLNENGVPNRWMDCRNFILSDNSYRDAKVDWQSTEEIISKKLLPIAKKQIIITQGFIARASDLSTTTLGRDGSDYSAAIFAYCLSADSVTIWKDVPGVMNGDPKKIENTVLFDQLSYNETIELAYYGANVIHPKTIQPLRNKNIPLYVKSFYKDELEGTVINATEVPNNIPVFIIKENQVMISISTLDFSFIVENHISHIFNLLSQFNIKVNLMQNSAINFKLCVDDVASKNDKFLEALNNNFEANIVHDLQLISIKNPHDTDLELYRQETIYMEQHTQTLVQLLV
ncbi:MAG: aspartate kinase [Bacteroidetes bacterium]|nr:aspartate kinase [Bacteroidota bacterium]